MDQAVTAKAGLVPIIISRPRTMLGRSGAALVLVLITTAASAGHPSSEPPVRPVGVVEQPCPTVTSPPDLKDFHERLLDPSAGREFEPVDMNAVTAARAAEDERLHSDWASLCHYRTENAALHRPGAPRVVFMGDSITEFWKIAHPEFFGESYLDRGVSGQTTAQILVRFRQDVIALKPAVVHILAGTNDFAGNGGPTTFESIRNNIASMVDLALANDIRVVLGSIPPAGAFPWRPTVLEPAQHIVEMNEWLRHFAREKNLIYVDYHEPLADERDAMKQTFSNDGVHPNRDGYSVMEPLARHAIEQALSTVNEPTGKVAPGSAPPGAKPPKASSGPPR
jgi:lysophospholipase L1-like esterase